MKFELTVPEVVDLIKEIQHQFEGFFEMMRVNVKESVGRYLSELMDLELTHFLGRDPYERGQGDIVEMSDRALRIRLRLWNVRPLLM